MVCYLLDVITCRQDYNIDIPLVADSHSPKDSVSPLPKLRGATVKSEKRTHSKRNLRSGMIIIAHNHTEGKYLYYCFRLCFSTY